MNVNDELLRKIWAKAPIVDGYDDGLIRQDPCGAWIRFDKYGDRSSAFGWEIDHVYPKATLEKRNVPQEEIDDFQNLRPMNWMNNDSKGVDYPEYHVRVQASGTRNVECDKIFVVSETCQNTLRSIYDRYFL